jgi:heat shock protein HslJ
LRVVICTFLAFFLAACTPPANTSKRDSHRSDAKAKSAQVSDEEAKLYGAWRILSLNGSAVAGAGADADRIPRLKFWAGEYGGNTGCNDFGGQGLMRDNRYYTKAGMMTAVACPKVNAQEDAIIALMRDGPTVSFLSDGSIALTTPTIRAVLAKDDVASRQMRAQSSPSQGVILAGTSWQITSVDGAWLNPRSQREARPLVFEANYWSAKPACATLSGGWQPQGRTIVTTSSTSDGANRCPPQEAVTDGLVADIMRANPSVALGNLLGPGSELLLVGDGHWVTASRNPTLDGDASLLTGIWTIASIDGASPKGGRTPTLSFGAGRYVGDTGCNMIGGYFLAQTRRLFTLATPQTEMGCAALTTQEERITALLTASPRIGRLRAGGIALIDERGQIDLQRGLGAPVATAQLPAPTLDVGTLRVGTLTIDGQSLLNPPTEPAMRLSFTNKRWATTLGCGMTGGDWSKRDGVYWFYTDAGTYPPPLCSSQKSAHKDSLSGVMNGPARVLIGANGAFLLATKDHWIAGQVEGR